MCIEKKNKLKLFDEENIFEIFDKLLIAPSLQPTKNENTIVSLES